MKKLKAEMRKVCLILVCTFFGGISYAQTTVSGSVIDAELNEAIIGANIIIENTAEGTVSDWDGTFEFTTDRPLPFNVVVSYIGFADKIIEVLDESKIEVLMAESSEVIEAIVVKGSRISEENKKSPLTVESLDVLAVKETPASNFYEGLGALKGVDLTTASLGFQVINTRGFNSTSPVRSLQIIDGVDNQAPGLNFSLGNFLGSSELDVLKVDIIVGASSAFYGPNAFNGVISMVTKNPFFQKGLSASVKLGERNLRKGEVRYADTFKNKEGHDWIGYKLNVSAFKADDWEANNFDPVFDTESGVDNPGGYDAINIYGDEYRSAYDQSSAVPWSRDSKAVGVYHRTGYKESDLLNYNTENLKTNAALHFRLNPALEFESPELIFAGSYSNGTTIYQGDNRFALKNIEFFQGRIELKKRDKYFLRAYMTKDDAGDTYDPYFTALLLQERSKSDEAWNTAYINNWQTNIVPRIDATGYPQIEIARDENGDPIIGSNGFPQTTFDYDALDQWYVDYQDSLLVWHQETEDIANVANPALEDFTTNFYEPGTERFEQEFNEIISTPSGSPQGGSRIIDKSALYHVHGEYKFEPDFLNYLKVGANARLYRPRSDGTIFIDSTDVRISNFEYGIYGGFEKSLSDDLNVSATLRMDKNENFDYLFSPAASLVWTPSENNFLRVSFSSAIRNPTLSDQYLDFNVGRATLRGNLNGVDSLIMVDSFLDFIDNLLETDRAPLEYFSIDPIRPEKVKTFEVGYRSTLFEKLYVDAGYYFSFYDDFIGYNLGLDVLFINGFPSAVNAFRYSANSLNQVTTQGLSIGLNYFFGPYYKVAGNYSWNKLNSEIDDPIIPAFNTPEHKYNIGISGRDIPLGGSNSNKFGFNINYKWVQGFIFEGSPQFTGAIPDYGLLDAQINYHIKGINTTFKLGASNLLNNLVFQTYGGPRIGRMAYASLLYEFAKK